MDLKHVVPPGFGSAEARRRNPGRLELLSWLNSVLETDYTKIEHLSDGIAFCQLMDIVYPGKVALQRLNFNASFESDFVKNLEIVEQTFKRLKISKVVPVQKLSKGRFQENSDFLMWLIAFVTRNCDQTTLRSYSGYERRAQAQRSSQGSRNNPTASRARINYKLVPNKGEALLLLSHRNGHRPARKPPSSQPPDPTTSTPTSASTSTHPSPDSPSPSHPSKPPSAWADPPPQSPSSSTPHRHNNAPDLRRQHVVDVDSPSPHSTHSPTAPSLPAQSSKQASHTCVSAFGPSNQRRVGPSDRTGRDVAAGGIKARPSHNVTSPTDDDDLSPLQVNLDMTSLSRFSDASSSYVDATSKNLSDGGLLSPKSLGESRDSPPRDVLDAHPPTSTPPLHPESRSARPIGTAVDGRFAFDLDRLDQWEEGVGPKARSNPFGPSAADGDWSDSALDQLSFSNPRRGVGAVSGSNGIGLFQAALDANASLDLPHQPLAQERTSVESESAHTDDVLHLVELLSSEMGRRLDTHESAATVQQRLQDRHRVLQRALVAIDALCSDKDYEDLPLANDIRSVLYSPSA